MLSGLWLQFHNLAISVFFRFLLLNSSCAVYLCRVFTHIFIHHDLWLMLGARKAESEEKKPAETRTYKMPKGFSYVDHGYVRSY